MQISITAETRVIIIVRTARVLRSIIMVILFVWCRYVLVLNVLIFICEATSAVNHVKFWENGRFNGSLYVVFKKEMFNYLIRYN